MPAPNTFDRTTQHQSLPLLFAGQSQKEFFVNQALTIVDALLPRSVVSSINAPPSDPAEGSVYRVTAPASDAWFGEEDSLAIRVGGDWHFVRPQIGIQVFDQSTEHTLVYRGQWERADAMAVPSGGTVVDVEARTAISELIQQLERIGILA